ncbi:MAG: NADPH-dependent glutamate synthase [Oscillospiraceae bacterium]
MFKIVEKFPLNESKTIYRATIEAPMIARAAKPGQFVIFRLDEFGERFPLTIAMYDAEKGTVTVHFQPVGKSTQMFSLIEAGDYIADIVGPLGKPAVIDPGVKRVLVVGGGTGCAINYPVAKELHGMGVKVDMIAGFKSKDIVIMEEEFRAVSDNLYITTDDGTYGEAGYTTTKLKELLQAGERYDSVLTCGPIIMMKGVADATRPYGIKTTASLNPIMIDGTGMCGGCRLTVAGERKFACVDGPEFDAHQVDWASLVERNTFYLNEEADENEHVCRITGGIRRGEYKAGEDLEDGNPVKRMTKHPMPEQEPNIRNKNFNEVSLGYTAEIAKQEALRCLSCKDPQCVQGCPVNVKIPEFIAKIKEGEFDEAYEVIATTNSLASVCGRVCPQERQCESKCVRGLKGESVAIGRLERYAADFHAEHGGDHGRKPAEPTPKNGHKVAVVGSGPSGLSCAGDLSRMGYEVSVFEALHKCGGVLAYGIPEFRLPKSIVDREVKSLERGGVKFVTDCIVGRTISLDGLLEEGFEAVFIGSGAGLPQFMNIPGENLLGVYSANEYLTRINLMKAYRDDYDTPIKSSARRIAVIGGGNVAMDAARCAKRMGADEVFIVYRRGRDELPARAEEIHHAEEEGIEFRLLNNPSEIMGDIDRKVMGLKCTRMKLGEPDASGRRGVTAIEGADFVMPADAVIVAIGTTPNPLLRTTTPGLESNKKGCLVVCEDTLETTREGVFAGGDAVTGAATVILAMGAGKHGARSIDEYIKNKK